MTNLKAIGSATYMYQADYDDRIPNGYAPQVNYQIHGNWKVLLAPYSGDLEIDPVSRNGQLEHGINNCPEQTSVIADTNAGDAGFYGGYAWNGRLGYNPDDGSYAHVSVSDIKRPGETVMIHDTFDFRTGYDFHHFVSRPEWQTGRRHNDNTTIGWVDGRATSVYFNDTTYNWYCESADGAGNGGNSWWDLE